MMMFTNSENKLESSQVNREIHLPRYNNSIMNRPTRNVHLPLSPLKIPGESNLYFDFWTRPPETVMRFIIEIQKPIAKDSETHHTLF